jgi:hypothetical protein
VRGNLAGAHLRQNNRRIGEEQVDLTGQKILLAGPAPR